MRDHINTDRDVLEAILDTLEKLLAAVSLQIASDKSMTDAVRVLKTIGLDNHTIASVLNTSDATIRVLSSRLKTPKIKSAKRR